MGCDTNMINIAYENRLKQEAYEKIQKTIREELYLVIPIEKAEMMYNLFYDIIFFAISDHYKKYIEKKMDKLIQEIGKDLE